MTAKTPKDENSDIIEGVAVEKTEPSARRGGRGTKAGSSRRKSAPDNGKAAEQASESVSSHPRRRITATTMPLLVSAVAVLLVVALAGYQIWREGRHDAALQSEVLALAGQLEDAQAAIVLLREELDTARAGQAGLGARIDGFEAALPIDPSSELAMLSTRLDRLEETAEAAQRSGSGGLSSDDTESGFANAALIAVSAMTAAEIGGGDPARWLPVLRRISEAGLDLGDLASLERLVLSSPPSAAALRVELGALVEMMKTGGVTSSDTGWWDRTTGRLGDFIRLRRSDAGSLSSQTVATNDPLQRLQRAADTGRLKAALEASHDLTSPPPRLRDWQGAATRRLELDAALAALNASAAARLLSAGVAD